MYKPQADISEGLEFNAQPNNEFPQTIFVNSMKLTNRCFSGMIWYLQHNYVEDTIAYHEDSDKVWKNYTEFQSTLVMD